MDPSIIQNKLNACYDNYGFYELSKENINSHNQYLDYFLKGGILLFISFIFILIVKLRHSLKQKNYLYFSITMLFSFAFITENILVRQYGMFIYVFCDVLLLGAILSDESHNTDKIEER
jgi:O-antigen ligase